ncbi:hypothetical protein PR202_ga22437 [Eleusine coracana subsp. coracana]|uniref:Uncharacterized protein n=1 Tax=Eleusine coracana subsp. coracana TaxID=191504 RepID=A0AAV5D3M1_ELECO|nr:hypothetical protein PR202_ga22437 [Eleusine coracana subsp. coracana]
METCSLPPLTQIYSSISLACTTPPADTTETIPLSVFDMVAFDQHMSSMHFFRAPTPPAAALELGFARILAEFLMWAGCLIIHTDGVGCAVLLNDAGAQFIKVAADVSLDNGGVPWEPTPERRVLHPSGGHGVEELMLVQVTRFACEGLVVGTTVHQS